MDIFGFITLFGGLAMFLYGMEIMSDGLEKSSGDTLRVLLQRLTRNTLTGVMTGMLVTAIIQSSSATIVLSVGLMSAGMLTLRQSISIVMGANIGTTVTAQIIRLMDLESSGNILLELVKPSTLAPLALIAGVVLVMFIKKPKLKGPGLICLGFGVLFMGLLTMTDSVEPLSESETFINFLTAFSEHPLLEILAGIVVTVIVQSSSAVVGMLQALSSTGAMTFSLIYPLIMGVNIGTCIVTAVLCSLGTSRDAKRVGLAHVIFNVTGTLVFMLAMTIIRHTGGLPELWGSTVDSGSIANFQTLFNVVTTVLLLPFVNLLMRATLFFIRPDDEEQIKSAELAMLDEKLLVAPNLAMAEASAAVARMGELASTNVSAAIGQFTSYDMGVASAIASREDRIDRFADRADNYLIRLSHELGVGSEDAELNMLMQSVPGFERIGDYAVTMNGLAEDLISQRHGFSAPALRELAVLSEAVDEMTRLTSEAFERDDSVAARGIEPLREVISDMALILRDNHTARLRTGECSVSTGIIFLEIINCFERIASHCSNIALLMQARSDKDIRRDHRAYIQLLRADGGGEYAKALNERKQEYLDRLARESAEEN